VDEPEDAKQQESKGADYHDKMQSTLRFICRVRENIVISTAPNQTNDVILGLETDPSNDKNSHSPFYPPPESRPSTSDPNATPSELSSLRAPGKSPARLRKTASLQTLGSPMKQSAYSPAARSPGAPADGRGRLAVAPDLKFLCKALPANTALHAYMLSSIGRLRRHPLVPTLVRAADGQVASSHVQKAQELADHYAVHPRENDAQFLKHIRTLRFPRKELAAGSTPLSGYILHKRVQVALHAMVAPTFCLSFWQADLEAQPPAFGGLQLDISERGDEFRGIESILTFVYTVISMPFNSIGTMNFWLQFFPSIKLWCNSKTYSVRL
jgi:hypothetical protein